MLTVKMKCSVTTAKLLLAACIIVIFHKASGCPPSWIRYGDHCYFISQEIITRHVARLKCNMEGGDLASITNSTILNFLSQHIIYSPHSKFWVGLERKDEQLVWFDGTKSMRNQSYVKIPAPHEYTYSVADFFGSGCFIFDGTFVEKEPCYQSYPFICGQKVSNKKNHTVCHWEVEPEHSFIGEITGNCLFRTPMQTVKDAAENKCKNYRAHFVDFDDMMKDGLSAFHDHKVLTNDGSTYWTNFEWNGTNLIRSDGEVVPEQYPIPVIESSGSCITVQFNFTDILTVKFYQTECNGIAYTVCSLDNSNLDASSTTTRRSVANFYLSSDDSCPEGYNWKTDRTKRYCYWETSFETDQLSWNDAEKYCQGYGGHLASFHSVDEEKLGLSFQYSSLDHNYWIGLTFDPENETYTWTDGSPLDYQNWAPGHPDSMDKKLQCVSMHAQDKHWKSSLCGILSWFICKVEKKGRHPNPYPPTPTPLESCDKGLFAEKKSSWYFKGACYFSVIEILSWHRAKKYCEDQGATLASIHSTEEIGFLLRLLHESAIETNRAWIGLNSFGSDGSFHWTDYTAVDFTFFAKNEPNNRQNQEKCCNMNTRDGMWNDENCNAGLGFICKRINDTSVSTVVPTTQDPRIGNCKKGWIDHYDRCYYIGGKTEKERLNFTEAMDFCQDNGGYLTSIRDSKEQGFLAYLLQIIGEDAWIGLHDTIQYGRYFWLDNSDLQYTNWAPGEPSYFGMTEDCVKMAYNHLDSGVWKDDECHRKFGFICQMSKDPKLPPPPTDRGMNCVHPEGWLKLNNMCFQLFEQEPKTWYEAELSCYEKGGHLVSVSDHRVKAVVTYLTKELNQPFFIGLRYDKNSRTVKWGNNFPVRLTNWEKNEPSFMTEDTCFASTSEGYWKKALCDEQMPYICQITTGKPKKLNKFVGNCSTSSNLFVPGSGSYCYIMGPDIRSDWYTANLMCFRYGSHLVSIHSMEEIEDIKKMIKPGIRSIFIGLMRNRKGGFTWIDDTPVNFENWEEEEPSNYEDQCVEMMTDNMKWRVTPCISEKNFICVDLKTTLEVDDPEASEYSAEYQRLSTTAICSIVFGLLVAAALIVAAALYRKKTYKMPQFRRPERSTSVSFENALYDVSSSSMVFNDENKS